MQLTKSSDVGCDGLDSAADSGPYLRGPRGGGVHVLGVWEDPKVHRHQTSQRMSLPIV